MPKRVKAEARLARTHACVGSSPVRRRYRCPRRIAASPSPSYASRRLRWKRQDATRVCTRTARGAAKCSILARVCDAPEVVAAAHFNGLQAWHPHPFHHFARHPNALTQRPPRRCVPLTGVRLCHRPHCCVIVQSAARVCVACARASHCDSLRITSAGFPRARLRSLLQRWSRLSVLGGGWVQLYHCHRTPHTHTVDAMANKFRSGFGIDGQPGASSGAPASIIESTWGSRLRPPLHIPTASRAVLERQPFTHSAAGGSILVARGRRGRHR